MMTNKPLPGWPRLLRRQMAPEYIGVKPTKFDELVDKGIIPPAKQLDGIDVWDRYELDTAVDALPRNRKSDNPWDLI